MGGQAEGNRPGKQAKLICAGLLAHVDTGKTTLSEALLYESGMIRKAGRVDNGDAFLDNFELERARGITIFSKQAVLDFPEGRVTLLDTPGHVDFSAEMERTLQVLDYAVLLISGSDGVQGHTRTLWKLLERYGIPVFFFFNKMDQPDTNRDALLAEVKRELDEGCVDFSETDTEEFYENAAVCGEELLEEYLAKGCIARESLVRAVAERTIFPCYFGSALKQWGVREFLEGFRAFTAPREYPEAFGAKVFKITRDAQGTRLTWLKVTGGSLRVRQLLSGRSRPAGAGEGEDWEEKVNQIRICSGDRYTTVDEAPAGCVCAVTGLTRTYPGEGFGVQPASEPPMLEPVLTCRLILPEEVNPAVFLPKLRQLEEEEPQLHLVWDEAKQEIVVWLMGQVQTEILQSMILKRYGVSVEFGDGKIVYKETIADTVEGVGHFEPLRHYAEVHLLLEPGEPGSGLTFASACSEDVLDRNWQRLVLTHLEEKEHAGVLTGAAVTDLLITLLTGRAHLKHTEGGDFRQATYRAVRQGLMRAKSVLLEPYYDFVLEIPETALGRAMTDIERMYGTFSYENQGMPGQRLCRLTGIAPAAAMQNYQAEVAAYSKGEGHLFTSLHGYLPCHNAEEVIAQTGYDPERDTKNPSSSVFCAHGAGFVVPWDLVPEYMHLPAWAGPGEAEEEEEWRPERMLPPAGRQEGEGAGEVWIGTDEVDRILERTYHANKREGTAKRGYRLSGRSGQRRGSAQSGNAAKGVSQRDVGASSAVTRSYAPVPRREEYLLVDGYNIIFAWEELKGLAEKNVDGARGKLLDILCNYQGIRGCELIVVFDAYRVAGHQTEWFDYHNIHVVYTKEAETADQYIERFAHENARRYQVTVATSDGLEQIIIRGAGCALMSARELEQEVAVRSRELLEDYREAGLGKQSGKRYLLDNVTEEVKQALTVQEGAASSGAGAAESASPGQQERKKT